MSIPHLYYLVWVHDGMVVKKAKIAKIAKLMKIEKIAKKWPNGKKSVLKKHWVESHGFFRDLPLNWLDILSEFFFLLEDGTIMKKKIKQTCNFNYDALLIFAWTYFSKSNEIRKYEEKTLINVLFNSFQTVSRSFSSFLNILELLELGVNFW